MTEQSQSYLTALKIHGQYYLYCKDLGSIEYIRWRTSCAVYTIYVICQNILKPKDSIKEYRYTYGLINRLQSSYISFDKQYITL